MTKQITLDELENISRDNFILTFGGYSFKNYDGAEFKQKVLSLLHQYDKNKTVVMIGASSTGIRRSVRLRKGKRI
jgi:thioredoxin reductase